MINKYHMWGGSYSPANRVGFYLTPSLINFYFLINFLVELATLYDSNNITEDITTAAHVQSISAVKGLLREENTPVQRKYGTRYRKPMLRAVAGNDSSFFPTGFSAGLYKNKLPGGYNPIRYVVWNSNLMSGDFFLRHFWVVEKNRTNLIGAILCLFPILIFYQIILIQNVLRLNLMNSFLVTKKMF